MTMVIFLINFLVNDQRNAFLQMSNKRRYGRLVKINEFSSRLMNTRVQHATRICTHEQPSSPLLSSPHLFYKKCSFLIQNKVFAFKQIKWSVRESYFFLPSFFPRKQRGKTVSSISLRVERHSSVRFCELKNARKTFKGERCFMGPKTNWYSIIFVKMFFIKNCSILTAGAPENACK